MTVSVLDIFGSFLGWCPRFGVLPDQPRMGEEMYKGNIGLFAISSATGIGMIALYIIIIQQWGPEHNINNNLETLLSLLIVGSFPLLNLARTQWKIKKITIPISDWLAVRKVFVLSFVVIAVSSILVLLFLHNEYIVLNYPIVYFSYMIFNYSYARRAVRKDIQ
jgi:MFS family permease